MERLFSIHKHIYCFAISTILSTDQITLAAFGDLISFHSISLSLFLSILLLSSFHSLLLSLLCPLAYTYFVPILNCMIWSKYNRWIWHQTLRMENLKDLSFSYICLLASLPLDLSARAIIDAKKLALWVLRKVYILYIAVKFNFDRFKFSFFHYSFLIFFWQSLVFSNG